MLRGGAFNNQDNNVRAPVRNRNNPNNRNNNNGFRLVRAHIFLCPAGNITDRSFRGGCGVEALIKKWRGLSVSWSQREAVPLSDNSAGRLAGAAVSHRANIKKPRPLW